MAKAKKKQRFFDVDMPIIKKETQLYAFDVKELKGRTITYDLTRLLRGKSMLLKLHVEVDDEGKKAEAHPKEIKLMPYFLRRMMRKGTNYVEDSFETETKDSVVTVKPFMVTRKKVSREVRKALRDRSREELKSYLKEKTSSQIFEDLISNKLQKSLGLKMKKTYPLSLCEIRVFRVEKLIEKQKQDSENKKEK